MADILITSLAEGIFLGFSILGFIAIGWLVWYIIRRIK